MKGTVRKWGNSLAVRLPKRISDDVGLLDSSEVEITRSGLKIIIQPKPEECSLKELVKRMKNAKRPKIVFDDGPVGREAL
jgi:antitoxin MazE